MRRSLAHATNPRRVPVVCWHCCAQKMPRGTLQVVNMPRGDAPRVQQPISTRLRLLTTAPACNHIPAAHMLEQRTEACHAVANGAVAPSRQPSIMTSALRWTMGPVWRRHPSSTCAGAPARRLSIGTRMRLLMMARVGFQDVPIRLPPTIAPMRMSLTTHGASIGVAAVLALKH